MPGLATSRLSMRSRSRCKRVALTTARRSMRLPVGFHQSVDAAGNRPLLVPRFDGIPLVHRLVADDRMAVMLAKTLVELDIAVPGDWARADHDPISFVRLTLDRWIQAHGGPAIRRRFLLSAGYQQQSQRLGRA